MASKKPPVHTVKTGSGWANKQGSQVVSEHRKKPAAEAEGRREAKRDQTEHVIHGRNGRIQEKNSYGNDPNPPKDKR
jgi:hypothetical protein